ncbi:MAG: fibronectin type III domain-containing protein, partial [Victivallales bacterium]|nr:fibronectin type III domain-containing protein [Victivallales bacterium]
MGAWHRQNFRCFLSVIILSFIFICTTFGAVPVPEKLQALQATYQKITIKWETGDGDETVSSYKIFRDNVQIGTSTDAQYTDTGLNPGTVYVYKVVAVSVGGNESDNSDTCSIKTIASVPFDGSASVENVVDSMNPGASTNNTATMLLGAVQSGFEALFNTSITYTVIDGDLLSNFITEELNVINGAAEDMTAAERLAAQQELDLFMSENYGGNSFEHVYINSKLTELAEKHYFNGRKIAANELYELSLKYLSDRENIVSNSLHRMAYFKVAELTADSTVAETASAVAAYKNTALRFFEFFPGAINSNAENIYYRVMQEHFKRFSVLLTYDNYQTQSYQDAAAMATALLELNNSTLNQDRVARVTAWELVPLTMNFSDSNGNPAS